MAVDRVKESLFNGFCLWLESQVTTSEWEWSGGGSIFWPKDAERFYF